MKFLKIKPMIQDKVNKFGVAVKCEHTPLEYISSIFLREKTGGTLSLILNLKNLNMCLEYKHFKMQTLQTILTSIQSNCYIATIDFKDTYYSVMVVTYYSIYGNDTYFLKFFCISKLLKFVAFPKGLSPGPRKFTKLTKPLLPM